MKSERWLFQVEMIGNGFLYSHSLPFPHGQFSFLPIPIPKQYCSIVAHKHFGVSKTRLTYTISQCDDFSHYCVLCLCVYITGYYDFIIINCTLLLHKLNSKHCIRRREFIPMGIRAIPIPIQGDSHSFPFNPIPIPNNFVPSIAISMGLPCDSQLEWEFPFD